MILEGKKTILFPIDLRNKNDLEYFKKIHQDDKNHYFGRFSLHGMSDDEAEAYLTNLFIARQINVWIAYPKDKGKKADRSGFVYLSDMSEHCASLNGGMDPNLAKGLIDRLKSKESNTYTEDAFHSVLEYCFNELGFERIETDMLSKNKLAQKLVEKVGFKQEGRLRHAFPFNGGFEDVLIYSVLRGEFNNGKIQRAKD